MTPVHLLHLSRCGIYMSPVRIASKPMALRDAAPDTTSGTSIEHVTSELDEEIGGLLSDREFVAIRAAY